MLRFAPSPIEDMNIGNLRVAIFNYIVSKQLNEDLVIRIEDIDIEKNIEGKDKEIIEILNLFSIICSCQGSVRRGKVSTHLLLSSFCFVGIYILLSEILHHYMFELYHI